MSDAGSAVALEVEVIVKIEPTAESLIGFSLDLPQSAAGSANRELPVGGWAIGRQSPAIAVEFSVGKVVIARIPIKLLRPDVSARFPDVAGDIPSGFEGNLALIAPNGLSVEVRVVLQNQSRVPAAAIQIRGPRKAYAETLPLVSVVIPCYGQAHLLREALLSVLRQDHREIEIVVVDDGSPDNTEEIVRQFPGVRYVRQVNQGLSAARNTGLRMSSGDFVIFLDADDRLRPGAMSAALFRFAENPSYGFVAGHFRFIAIDGSVLASPSPRTPRADLYRSLLADYSVGPPGAVMFRRKVFDTVGPFDTAISPAADYDMVMKVAARFPVFVHDGLVLEYRRHGANMSGNPREMLSTTRRALAHQWLRSRQSVRLRQAYREGRRHWQESWGDLLVEKLRGDLSVSFSMDVLRDLWGLLRFYPRGLLKLSKE